MEIETAVEHKNRGNEFFRRGEFKDAVEEFTQAINLASQDAILYSNRSGAYLSLKEAKEALCDAEKCLELNPNFVKGYGRKGAALAQLNRLEEAKEAYEAGLKLDPENSILKQGLEWVKQSTEDSMGQFGQLLQAMQKNPQVFKYCQEDPAYLQRLLQELQSFQKDPSNISKLFSHPDPKIRQGLMACLGALTPGADGGEQGWNNANASPGSDFGKGESKIRQPDPEPEPEILDVADQHKKQGNELYSKKKFTEAIAEYDRAIELKPEELSYYYNKSAVYIELQDFEKAQKTCSAAVDLMDKIPGKFDIKAKVRFLN